MTPSEYPGSLRPFVVGRLPRWTLIFILGCAAVAGDWRLATAQETVILFGSCIQQERPTPIFGPMRKRGADLILFLGDNIYADTESPDVIRKKYEALAANPLFDQLRRSTTVMATWDDHDYGVNDGGSTYPAAEASRQEFLRFWQVPRRSPRWDREGVYNARIFGHEDRRIQVILLDTRAFRSALKTGPRRTGGPYLPDDSPAKTMLGETQWRWLETQLQKPATIRIIGSSIQFAAEAAGQEAWANLPKERERLLQLIRDTKAGGVIFVSGDRHWAELSKLDVGYPLYDLTSSSFNQTHVRGTPTDNPNRAHSTTYHRENYGVITIDWSLADPTVTLEIRTLEDEVVISVRTNLSELQF